MKELEEIWNSNSDRFKRDKLNTVCARTMAFELMREAYNLGKRQGWNEALDKAAENAEIKEEFEYQDDVTNEDVFSRSVDRDSILKLKLS